MITSHQDLIPKLAMLSLGVHASTLWNFYCSHVNVFVLWLLGYDSESKHCTHQRFLEISLFVIYDSFCEIVQTTYVHWYFGQNIFQNVKKGLSSAKIYCYCSELYWLIDIYFLALHFDVSIFVVIFFLIRQVDMLNQNSWIVLLISAYPHSTANTHCYILTR